jgi:hypothetical protein
MSWRSRDARDREMARMEDILAITFLFGGGAVFLLSISPVGRAIADRIRRGRQAMPQEEVTRGRGCP